MIKKNIKVGSSMIERPIPMLVQTAGRFSSSLKLIMDNKEINLKSIMGVISIGTLTGHPVRICGDARDENERMDGIVEFLS